MRFLADENCDFSVVKALRSQGFDVLATCEVCPGAKDESVIEMAEKEGRVNPAGFAYGGLRKSTMG